MLNVSLLSLPMLMVGFVSLVFFFFYHYLGIRMKNSDKQHKVFILFSILSFLNSVYSFTFFIMMNSGVNIKILNIANRIVIVSGMFIIVILIQFFKYLYNLKYRIDLYVIYGITAIFSIIAFINSPLFLFNKTFPTSKYYTGLEYGFLFKIWGGYLLIIMLYALFILIRAFIHNSKSKGNYSNLFLIITAGLWTICGVSDALTAVQIIDNPPLTWIGSFAMIVSIGVMLVSQIEKLYTKINTLYHKVIHDSLTGVYSRSFFEIELEKVFLKLKRENFKNYLIMIDIDNFKGINDNYGHVNGDKTLKIISEHLLKNMRGDDVVARFGGDEFIILMSNEKISDDEAITIIERIRKSINNLKIKYTSKEFTPSCSFGMTVFDHLVIKNNLTKEQVVAFADEALYRAKDKGKNNVSFREIKFE